MKQTMPQTCSWLLPSVKVSLGSGRSPRQRSWAKARSWTRPRWSPTCPGSTSCSGARPCLPRVGDVLLWRLMTESNRAFQIRVFCSNKYHLKKTLKNAGKSMVWIEDIQLLMFFLEYLQHHLTSVLSPERSMSYPYTDSAFGCFNL